MKKKPTNIKNIKCSLVQTVEMLGDRWSLLILRETFFGVKRFDGFRTNLGIATNILSNRLKQLVKNDILSRTRDQNDTRRFVYKLTEKGLDIYPIVLAMLNWGDRWLSWEEGPPLLLYHKTCGNQLIASFQCVHCGKEVKAKDVNYEQRF